MPLNIRAKPAQSKISAGSKSGGHADGSASHSRFSRSPKQGKGKQSVISTPGCRSGLEPGSVSGGLPAPTSKPTGGQGSAPRLSAKTKTSTGANKLAGHGSATAPGGKTLSMENIQSLSAAYATSGTMYPCEREALEPSGGYPKGTMTLGRSTSRSSYSGRTTGMGSSPNITSSGLHHPSDHYGDQPLPSAGTSSLRRQSGRQTQELDSGGRGEAAAFDLQAQLRELQRENNNLRRELEGGREGRSGPSINNVNFWSPDLKRDKGFRREEGGRTSHLKDHYRTDQDDVQQLPLTVQELQEELKAHREMNNRLQQQRQQGNSGSCRELRMDQEHRVGRSPGHSPRQSPSNLHSPGPKSSPRASPSNTYNPSQQEADIIIHSPGYGCNTAVASLKISPANTLQPGLRNSPNQPPYQGPAVALSSSLSRRCSPCQVPGCDGFTSSPPLDPSEENFFHLQSEHERQAKELFLLRKTMEEMETRIDSQKQTLGARDESIQRLLEMLQGQGQRQGHWGRGQRTGIISMAAQEAEAQLENMHVREDTKISSLERNIRDLEDEVQMLKTSGLLHPDDKQDELKQVEAYKSHSKFMKTKIEQLKQELNRKESDMQALQTKLETLANQNSDCKQHIEVLKESLNAKEQRANTLQTEVNALRVRLEEKEQFLTKKTKQLQDLTDEKSTLTGEIRDMKDMLDVKERKVNVLQKKIENLLEQLKDKDKQLSGLRERVQGLQTDSSNTDTALATLEEALSEKERVIENLREQKERVDRVQLEELEQMRKENQELKDKLSALQPQKVSLSLPANLGPNHNPRPDGEVVSAKIDALPAVSPTTQNTEELVRKCPDITDRLRLLEQEVARYREESGKSQAEVQRLMAALKDAEMDRTCKEKKITDLERQIKSPNIQKQSVAGEMRKDALADGHPHSLSQVWLRLCLPLSASQDAMRETAERITELERALRESMSTSAHREALWAQEESAHVQTQRELEELMGALEKTRQELDTTKLHLSTTQQSLHERDGHLNSLRQERRKQLEEILEMKQQALLAAISEKDANIALLELSSSKRRKAQEEVMALKREKDRLMHQLKQQTQSRMKMIADNYEEDHIHPQHHPHHSHHLHSTNVHHRSLPRGPPHANHRPPMDDDEEGIWA
ncbi:ERC protein 2-like [Aulostomus maculatus]